MCLQNDFLPIGFYSALILNRLRNDRALRELSDLDKQKRDVEQRDEKHGNRTDEDKEAETRRDLERRIRDITAMENRLRRKALK